MQFRRLLLTILLAAFTGTAFAYELSFSPNPAPVGAIVTATLTYFDSYGCTPARFKKVQGPTGVVRLQLVQGYCTGDDQPIDPNQSVSLAIGRFEPGDYSVEIVYPGFQRPEKPIVTGTLHVYPPPICIPDLHRLCLNEARFEVTVEWRDFTGGSGLGMAVHRDPTDLGGPESGYFWFFRPENLELMVKVLDGCAINGRYWVFLSPATTVGMEVHVADAKTLWTKTYDQPASAPPGLTADTDEFPCL